MFASNYYICDYHTNDTLCHIYKGYALEDAHHNSKEVTDNEYAQQSRGCTPCPRAT